MAVNHEKPSPQRSRGRVSLEQSLADLALDVSYAIARAENYREHLVNQVHLLFDADAGAGLGTWRPNSSNAADEMATVVAGAESLTTADWVLARPFVKTHPGFLAMARVGTKQPIRLSDHTSLSSFRTTESFSRLQGHSDGRYPMSALLLAGQDTTIFVALHRKRRDFSDADLARLAALQRPVSAALAFKAALDDTVRLLQQSSRLEPSRPAVDPTPRRGRDAAVHLCSGYEPTRREAEVLALAAEGWTNHQIGRRLGITERTVRKHLSAVYDKAGVRGRAAATAWWQRRHD
jgi:DNA-binding NarL/FixJ family response regulator